MAVLIRLKDVCLGFGAFSNHIVIIEIGLRSEYVGSDDMPGDRGAVLGSGRLIPGKAFAPKFPESSVCYSTVGGEVNQVWLRQAGNQEVMEAGEVIFHLRSDFALLLFGQSDGSCRAKS